MEQGILYAYLSMLRTQWNIVATKQNRNLKCGIICRMSLSILLGRLYTMTFTIIWVFSLSGHVNMALFLDFVLQTVALIISIINGKKVSTYRSLCKMQGSIFSIILSRRCCFGLTYIYYSFECFLLLFERCGGVF